MTVSVVLRLLTDRLAHGVLAGQVELVHSGERGVVHDADELTAYLQAHLCPPSIEEQGR